MSTDTPTTSSTFTVVGMSCGHCTAAVAKAVRAIDGVAAVDVDLASGAVTVASTGPLDVAVVAAAVDDAGYELAP